MRQEYVYVLWLALSGRYKIGRTVNPHLRFAAMMLPEQPQMVGLIPCSDAKYVERNLHSRFASERKHGEWFELSLAQSAELLFWCRVLSVSQQMHKLPTRSVNWPELRQAMALRTGKGPARVYSMRRKA